MELTLEREPSTVKATIGHLSVDGQFECLTLEDVVRPVKIAGQTAIPAGRYVVDITFSHRFQRLMPQLLDVPGFEGIRIHAGNTDADTEGCILVGRVQASADFISQSRNAFAQLYNKLAKAKESDQPIFITISQ